ncbi:38435_t:CDS:2, partial [Gigaspora margarita]
NSLTANVTNATVNPSMVGEWKEVGKTAVAAMHIVLVRPTKMLIIDKAEKNHDAVYPDGHYAFSSEYDLTTGKNLEHMDSARWYNTMVTLPDGRIFNIGGSTKSI